MSVVESCHDTKTEYASIIGQWIAEDDGDLTAYRRYDVSIERVPYDSSLYIIRNFYRTGNTAELYVRLIEDSIFINSQLVGGYTIDGEGVVNNTFDKINMNYDVYGGSVGFEKVICVLQRN